jgi:hypothetical protein
MQRTEFPVDVLRFVEARIDSVPHLESLLLFWENPAASWTEADIAARIYVSRERAGAIVADLLRHGFIATTDGQADHYRYDPAWDEAGMMERVATLYRRHVVQLAGLIHEKSGSGAVRDFARAFQFKNGD